MVVFSFSILKVGTAEKEQGISESKSREKPTHEVEVLTFIHTGFWGTWCQQHAELTKTRSNRKLKASHARGFSDDGLFLPNSKFNFSRHAHAAVITAIGEILLFCYFMFIMLLLSSNSCPLKISPRLFKEWSEFINEHESIQQHENNNREILLLHWFMFIYKHEIIQQENLSNNTTSKVFLSLPCYSYYRSPVKVHHYKRAPQVLFKSAPGKISPGTKVHHWSKWYTLVKKTIIMLASHILLGNMPTIFFLSQSQWSWNWEYLTMCAQSGLPLT